jgi:bacteriorhodopsin
MSAGMLIVFTGLLFYLITCVAILDIARKEFGGTHIKAMWGFVALIPFFGCLAYFLFGCRKGKKRERVAPAESE